MVGFQEEVGRGSGLRKKKTSSEQMAVVMGQFKMLSVETRR